MSSDVEMLVDDVDAEDKPQLINLHSPSPRHSPITIRDDSSIDSIHATPPPRLSVPPSSSGIEDGPTAVSVKEQEPKKKSKAPGPARPSSSAQAAGAKPKSTKSTAVATTARSPSPSPPPPPTRPPLQTIRLEITLGGPDHYEVDISSLSKESGQRAPTPVPVKRDSSDSEGDDEGEGEGEGEGKHEKKKRRRKKNIAQEYYDVSDPFIDDSELAVDERMFFAQTKQQGFYVSSGQVALLTDKPPPKKPKSKKVTVLPPAASITAALSTASLPPLSTSNANHSTTVTAPPSFANGFKGDFGDSASAMSMDANASSSGSVLKRKSPETDASHSHSHGKKKRKVELRPFHPELETMIKELQVEITKENWQTKGRFPQGMKPLLGQVALKAVLLGEYDDNFFNYMPKIFPYNRFTMMKLIKRTIWRDHINLLQDRSKELLQELELLAQEGFPKAQEEWEKAVVAWEKRERVKADGTTAPSAEGTPSPSDAALQAHIGVEDAGNDTSVEQDHEHEHDEEALDKDKAGGAAGGKESHPPPKKYRLTDKIKAIIWQLVCLSNECCRIENEKNQLENNNQVVSDQGVRKTLYQKIVAAFPKDWVTSGQISREVSVMKKKYEKEQENE